jgi:S-adenosyl-L-methionine hydrolase (adenosine-forming)
MAIATLTTDWSRHDFYVAALKGEILKKNPAAAIIDISHQIPPFQLQGAAYVVRGAFHHFPEKSVHIIGVDSEPTPKKPVVAVSYQGHFFVAVDNGVMGLICDTQPDAVVTVGYEDLGHGFNALLPFAQAAAALTLGEPIESIGAPKPSVNHMPMLLPVLDASYIIGNIIYIDTFGNIITNITRQEFDRVAKGRRYEILIQSNRYKVKSISTAYNAVEDGEFVAIFNSAGHLEVAQNKGRIASILNLDTGSSVRVNFFNP